MLRRRFHFKLNTTTTQRQQTYVLIPLSPNRPSLSLLKYKQTLFMLNFSQQLRISPINRLQPWHVHELWWRVLNGIAMMALALCRSAARRHILTSLLGFQQQHFPDYRHHGFRRPSRGTKRQHQTKQNAQRSACDPPNLDRPSPDPQIHKHSLPAPR